MISGASAQGTITASSMVNISSCPITFLGETYGQIYVSNTKPRPDGMWADVTKVCSWFIESVKKKPWFLPCVWFKQVSFLSDKFAVCFNGYYGNSTGLDCILGPLLSKEEVTYQIEAGGSEADFFQSLATIKTHLLCTVTLKSQYSGADVSV